MPLNKQNLSVNFAGGLDTKSDPFQVSPGKFLSLQNSVFTKQGLLQKRNGYGSLVALPDSSSTFLTTFNGNLTAIGNRLNALSAGSSKWIDKGPIQPVKLATLPLVRSTTQQSQSDTAIAPNGLICTVYTDNLPNGSGGTVPSYKYVIADAITGQNIVPATVITPTTGSPVGSPLVFLLGSHFIIVFINHITSTYHLQYISISTTNTDDVSNEVEIASTVAAPVVMPFDGIVVNNSLYLAWNGNDVGGAVHITRIDSTLVQHNTATFAGHSATIMSVTADESTNSPIISASYYDSGTTNGYNFAVNQLLNTIHGATQIITSKVVDNITSVASNGICTVYYEVDNSYGYDSSIPTHYINQVTISQSGSVGPTSTLVRSVGLASKAFIINAMNYFLAVYSSPFQPSYFLINGEGQVVSELSYSNGSGYYTAGLPSVTVNGTEAQVAYLRKDSIEAVNKSQGAPNAAGVYSQIGINLATFDINSKNIVSVEIGNDLYMSGGFLWMYDGILPVETNFFVWPDSVEATPSTTGGAMLPQQYFYVATYEWSDNNGNVFRSAPSIPVEVDATLPSPTPITFTSVFTSGVSSIVVNSATGLKVGQFITDTTTGANIQANTRITSIVGTTIGLSLPTAGASASSPGDTLSTSDTVSVVIDIPTLRLTYKITNPVKIVLYRWSAAQQIYYQVTSISSPLLNDTTIDYVTFTDKQADSDILGNNILYTTGGVVEDIAPPANITLTLFQSRLFLVDAEDRNLLWFSKQVIENTPVEMSDLLTLYIAPTTGAQGSTGPITALSALDDKLIIFKKDAVYYINGTGPDNTGANSQFSEPIFITSVVGCPYQNSIVFMPQGLMFQSDKGIWLLGRDLSTNYIGAPVESFTQSAIVQSAVNVPGTNQVRFTLDSGITLMYDYYFGQWGSFVSVPAISSTLYQDLHTYINSSGLVFQETPGLYLDATNPVLMSFTSSWFSLAGLQGFERFYEMLMLGQYITPFRLSVSIAYDFNPNPAQQVIVTPDNYSPNYGGDPLYGSGSPYGGPGALFEARVFPNKQKVESFQITINELYDATKGVASGAGLTLSGMNLVIGLKKGYRTSNANRSFG